MRYLPALFVLAFLLSGCYSAQQEKKDTYYKTYYQNEGTQTPQEAVK